MSEVVIDHTRPSYSAPLPNPREDYEQETTEQDSEHVRHAGDDTSYSERWSHDLNTRVPSRPPGELRAVDE